MRKLILSGVCFCLLLVGLNVQATTSRRDPGDAFPWGSEIPFPWKGIQGTWTTIIENQVVYFAFSTVRSAKGVNQLKVKEYLGPNCILVAEGSGFEFDRVVRALMRSPTGEAFNLAVHVFREDDLKNLKNPSQYTVGIRTVTVMSVTPLANDVQKETFQLYKVSSSPKSACPMAKGLSAD